jgi:hypothetical protein
MQRRHVVAHIRPLLKVICMSAIPILCDRKVVHASQRVWMLLPYQTSLVA